MAEIFRLPSLSRFDEPSFKAFHRELNQRLERVSEVLEQLQTQPKLRGELDAGKFRITRVGTARSNDDAVPLGQLSEIFDDLRKELLESLTSEATLGGTTTGDESSQDPGVTQDDIEAALENAQPTAAPPNVAAASDIGTVAADGQIRFSYQDHTHGGVLGAPVAGGVAGQVAFFTSTFQIDGDDGLFYDFSTDRLRIGGTGAPQATLHVVSSRSVLQEETTDVGATLQFMRDDGAEFRLIAAVPTGVANEYDIFLGQSTAATRFFVFPGLFTGIGTNTPLSLFYISGGTLTVFNGNAELTNSGTAGELRLFEPSVSGVNYTSFKAQVQAATIDYTLPAAQGAVSTFLQNDGTGLLTWATAAGAGLVSGTGAAGRVAFWSDASTISSDADLLYDSTTNFLSIGTTTTPNSFLQISWETATVFGFTLEKFGTSSGPSAHFRQARGTQASPTATQLNDSLGAFNFSGRGATAALDNAAKARFTAVAAEVWTDTASGTFLNFEITAPGTVSRFAKIRARAAGVGIGSNLDAAANLHVREDTLGNEVFRLESIATNDDPNYRVFQNRAATTNATLTTLHTLTIAATTTYLVEARVVARRTGGAAGTAEDGAAYVIRGVYKNVAGTATLIGTVDTFQSESVAAYDATLNVSAGTVLLQVTGVASTNVTWHATIIVQNVST